MRIVATGDSLFSSAKLKPRLDKRVLDILSDSDAAFTNVEFSCPRYGLPPTPKRWITAVRGSGALDDLKSLNLTLFSAANNQMGDFGHEGVVSTLEEFEKRDMIYAGLGRSLSEAREAKFLDTPKGRIGLVAATSTRAALYAASNSGTAVAARAGVNPLRFARTYILPDEQYEQMLAIDAMLGLAKTRGQMRWIEAQTPLPENVLQFGSLFEGYLQIERGEKPDILYTVNEKDEAAILENIKDAKARADIVIMSIHSHEGPNENWYSWEPAAFIRNFAFKAIDAGADAVFGHGAHFLRGVEFRNKKPIFYSLGSLFFEFEMGQQLNSPENYSSFNLPEDSKPSALHLLRRRDPSGKPWGFYGDPRFSQSVVAVCDFEPKGTKVSLVPLDLDLNRERASERGLPHRATDERAEDICGKIADLSRSFGTAASFDAKSMTLNLWPS